MEIIFLLESKHGHIGDVYYDWQCPSVPRIGEGVSIENIFDEGRFVVSEDDKIESTVNNVEAYVKSLLWKVTGSTWCKKDEYYMLISLFGE